MTETIRCSILGTKGAGKSSLLERFINDQFSFNVKISHTETVYQKKLSVESREVLLEILDISADFLVPELFEKWATTCDGFIILYNIGSQQSFKVIEGFKDKLDALQKDKEREIPVILIGAQVDKESQRQVSSEQGRLLAKSWGCPFHETSSKTAENVDTVFQELIGEVWKQNNRNSIKIDTKNKKPNTPKKMEQRVVKIKKGSSIANMLPFTPTDERKISWEKQSRLIKQWTEIEPSSLDSIKNCPIDKSCKSKGYLLEVGRTEFNGNEEIDIEDLDDDYPYYREEMARKEHLNYIGEVDPIGPVIISLESPVPNHRTKVIVRTKYGHDRMFAPTAYTTAKEVLKYIKTTHPKLQGLPKDSLKSLFPVSDPQLPLDLIDKESKEIVTKYKIGLLYVVADQTDEDDMYSNVDMSRNLQEFLSFIGEVIDLQGFTHYNGGLDVKANSTGKKSVYTKHRGMEIMFHVSTLLPFQPDDKQRVERKRHIGNDMVVLIFKEGNQTFDPCILKSQFNHVFLIVQVHEKTNENTKYSVTIANKPGVRPYSPFLPFPAIFDKSTEFRDFLLTKLINGQRGAMYSNEFKAKMMSTRRTQLEELIKQYSQGKGKGVNQPVAVRQLKPQSPQNSSEGLSDAKEQVEDIVSLGKRILHVTGLDAKEFDPETFKSYLQQILHWSVNTEKINFSSQEEHDQIILQAKSLFKVGNAFAELQENKRRGVPVDTTKFDTLQRHLREHLASFFRLLKDLSKHKGATHAEEDNGEHQKNDVSASVKHLIDVTFVKLIQCITAPVLDEDLFVEYLRSIGSTMREVANVVDEEHAKKLVEITKNLMQKGLQYRQGAPSNELVSALKHLITLLKEVTD